MAKTIYGEQAKINGLASRGLIVLKIMFLVFMLLLSAGCENNAAPEAEKKSETPKTTETVKPPPAEESEENEDSAASPDEMLAPTPESEPEIADAGGEMEVYEDGFGFVYNGESIYMGEFIDGVVEKLGPALNYIESESCTSEGMMKTYYYSGAEISAYAKTESDEYRIFSIILTDDSVTTAEGLYIGQTESEMVATYGTDYQSVPGVFCKYSKNGTGLTFDLDGEVIICITYTLQNI
ncbi:MAG: hypothetical protein FWG34_07560 [Oscillospiraceae bacterium]|nr:hypothetical protein [Oscillospiraceae bacterium]